MRVVGEIFPLPAESYLSLTPLIAPLVAAYLAQRWSTRSPQRQQTYERLRSMSDTAMIPLMCLLLALMCSAYTPAVLNETQLIPRLAGLYLTYAILAGVAAWLLSRVMSRPERIAVTFSAVTRKRPHHLPRRSALRTTPGTQREPRSKAHERYRTHPNPHRTAHHGRHDRDLPDSASEQKKRRRGSLTPSSKHREAAAPHGTAASL